MLVYIQGNRIEDLASALGRLMREQRRERFSLRRETVIVNNLEMGRWLSNYIAEDLGICANVRFSLAGSFVWELARALVPEISVKVLTRDDLHWLILSCLQELIRSGSSGDAAEDLRVLRTYLEHQGSRGLFHLAGELSTVFDRYINYRWDMLVRWESEALPEDPEKRWQARLWRTVAGRSAGVFKMAGISRFLEILHSCSSDETGGLRVDVLPSRLFIFGVSHLPPVHLQVFSALASCVDVYLFAMNPCRRYWEDIVPERFRASLRGKTSPAEVDDLFPVGNRLLASLGRAGRSFLSCLYELPFQPHEQDLFFRPEGDLLLHDIQRNILQLQRRGRDMPRLRIAREDDSLLISSCYSRMREVEALQDHLLHLFDTRRDLHPHEVLVMAPDIGEYASLVHAVFGSAPEKRHIPYSVCDVGMETSNNCVRALLAILDVIQEDLNAPQVMDILFMPEVAARFGLAEDEPARIRQWVAESGIRRGSGLSHGELYQNSWSFGLDRLFFSYCTSLNAPVEGVLPFETAVEGTVAELLGSLSSFFFKLHALKAYVERDEERPVEEWREFFSRMIRDFLHGEEEVSAEVQELHDVLNDLFAAIRNGGVTRLFFGTMFAAVEEALRGPAYQRAFFSGNVIFSSLVPMRTLPFRVICLLGMNDADFPRNPTIPSFDLVSGNPRRGERLPRDEDRYLFLETLLSARRTIYISYVGRSERDDSVANPSVVVSELMDMLEEEYEAEGGGSVLDQIVRHHPLQPFSPRYLKGDHKGLFSYAGAWCCPVDREGRPVKKTAVPPFVERAVSLGADEEAALQVVSPADLAWFFSNPQRFFLKKILKVDLDIVRETVLEDSEPFWIGTEMTWKVEDHLRRLTSTELERIRERRDSFIDDLVEDFKLRGLLPVDPIDRMAWEHVMGGRLKKLLDEIAKNGIAQEKPALDFMVRLPDGEEMRVAGAPGLLGAQRGLLDYVFTLYDHHRVSTWIRHLVLCAGLPGPGGPGESRVINTGTHLVINPVSGEEARRLLADLLYWFRRGHTEPIPLFVKASYGFAKALNSKSRRKKSEDPAAQTSKGLEKAWKAFFDWRDFEVRFKNKWVPLAFRGRLERERLLDERFRNLSLQIFVPMLSHVKKGR